MLVRVLSSLLLPLTLGACAMSSLLPDWTTSDVAGPEPAYRFLIANSLQKIMGNASPSETLQISTAERVSSLSGASWRVCLKAQRFPLPPRYYVVFIRRVEVVDARLSVVIDQCEIQSYSDFNWQVEAAAPPAPAPDAER